MFFKPAKSSPIIDQSKILPRSAMPSVVSADMKIMGAVESRGELQVDGTIEGDVTSRAVTISNAASVRGSISADTVRVSGTVKGDLTAKSVTLTATAKVEGDIVHQSLAIESGAAFEGQCKRMAASERFVPAKTSLLVSGVAE